MPDEKDKIKDDNEKKDDIAAEEEVEPEDIPSPSPDTSKQIVEGIGYLGGLIEELMSVISENFASIQEKLSRMNNTLDDIKKLKSEQMSTISQDPEKKSEHRSTLSETAQKIKAQSEKERGTEHGPKHPSRGNYPRHPKKRNPAEEHPSGSDGGTPPASEQSHNDSPKPDMGTVPSDSQGEAKPG